MNNLKNYYKRVLKYDFLNKFFYKDINKIPSIKKVILNFNCKSSDLKKLSLALLTLELITKEKSKLTKLTNSSLNLKIKKGYPIGCKVILKNKIMETFISQLLNQIFPNLRNFKGLVFKKLNKNSFSFTLKDLSNFNELNSNFYLFKNLPFLNITIVFETKDHKELIFFINALKLPIKQ